MDQLTDESKFILTQFFLADPLSDQPRVHQKKKEKSKGTGSESVPEAGSGKGRHMRRLAAKAGSGV